MPGRRSVDRGAAPPSAAVRADSDRRRRWHQQQASQIELDLLLQARAADPAQLAATRHYAALYEQAPAGYLSLDDDGRITRANHAAAALLGQRRDVLVGLALEDCVAAAARPRLRRFVHGLFAGGGRGVLELAVAAPAAGRRASRLRVEAQLDQVARQCRLILTDIGSAGRREAARQRAFQVLDHLGEGVVVCDQLRRIVDVNPAFTRLTGYQVEDVLGRRPGFLLSGGDKGDYLRALRTLRRSGRWLGEPDGMHRDGRSYAAALSVTAMRDADGGVTGYIGVLVDISRRRQTETALRQLSSDLDARVVARTAELAQANCRLLAEVEEHKRTAAQLQQSREQLRRLAAHQETVREQERQRIARDIHDDLGQNLLALRIDIGMLLARSGAAEGRLRRGVSAALENVDSTIRSVRGIMNELRPAVLDLGLYAALEWQVQEFSRRSGLACALALAPETQLPPLAAPLELALFRNLQEALVNVRRHAGADAVDVRLTLDGGLLELSVEDNGVGLPPGGVDTDGFGLIAMEQRMVALGGRLRLGAAAAGRGCRLVMSFDL